MNKRDFFFGAISKGKQGAEISLHNVVDRLERVPIAANFFTAQLNRLLRDNNGKIALCSGTSYPPFWELISMVAHDEIGFIEIYARTDVNDSMNATLACDVVLQEGVVSVVPHWCAYKESRAKEIVSTLLVPLHLNKLQDKTVIRFDEETTERLVEDDLFLGELKNVFSLAKYPHAMESQEMQDELVRSLEYATEIGVRGMTPYDALEAYTNRRR